MRRAACTSELLKIPAHKLATAIGDFSRGATIDWAWGNGSWMTMRSDTDKCITLHYNYQGKPVDPYQAQLVTTAQPLGGVRWWWRCPRCRRRVAALYGGRLFLCRHCHGLTYATVQERRDLLGTIDVRLGQLQRKLKGEGNFLTLPNKPKWMRWHTYSRLAGEYRELLRLRDQAWMIDVLSSFGNTYLADIVPRTVNLDLAAKDTEQQYREIRRKYRKHNFRED